MSLHYFTIILDVCVHCTYVECCDAHCGLCSMLQLVVSVTYLAPWIPFQVVSHANSYVECSKAYGLNE